jgi:signal transduction histidine kinase
MITHEGEARTRKGEAFMQQAAMAQWAHDIRNALSTVALYVETLDCPAGEKNDGIIACTHALLARAAAMCNEAVRQAGPGEPQPRRARHAVADTLGQIRDLVAPTLPAGALQVAAAGAVEVLADAQDVFRILFNLVHNAATLARRCGTVRRIRLAVESTGTTAIITVADDGPGLPEAVRERLFRRGTSATGSSGYGLSIARELAERNGGTLELAEVAHGTTFVLELPRATAKVGRAVDHHRSRGALQPHFA